MNEFYKGFSILTEKIIYILELLTEKIFSLASPFLFIGFAIFIVFIILSEWLDIK